MTTYTVTHPSATIPYIPGGAFTNTMTRFLNASQQALCYAIYEHPTSDPVCPAYVNCILEQLDEYEKIGLGSGTQLLTLIPAALAFLPSLGPDVNAVITMEDALLMRAAVLCLGAFCGLFPVGQGFRNVRSIIPKAAAPRRRVSIEAGPKVRSHGVNSTQLNPSNDESIDTISAIRASFRKVRTQPPPFSPAIRWTCIMLSTLFALAILYASLVLGLLGVVTWACNRQLLAFSWVVVRMAPTLLEALSLATLRWWVFRTDPRPANGSPRPSERSTISRLLEIILSTMEVSVRGLHGGIAIYGIAVLGSTTLIDGIPAMMLLLAMPALYGIMVILILGAMKE